MIAAGRPSTPARLSILEHALRLFTDIRPGEGRASVVMFANVFLLLSAYYFVKPLRDGWIAISDVRGLSTMEVKAYTSFAQSVFLIGAVSVYARLTTRWRRRALIIRATGFCMANLVVFWLLRPGFLLQHVPGAGVVFYIWVGMFGAFVMSQFWAFAADLYDADCGYRLLPFIAIGATAGATAGSFLSQAIVRSEILDSGALLLAANLPLAGSMMLTVAAESCGATGEGPDPAAKNLPAARRSAAALGHHLGAFGLMRRDRYLLAIGAVTLLTNWVSSNGDNLLFRVVQEALGRDIAAVGITDPSAVETYVRDGTTAFYGSFFFWVNACALALQALIASRLLKYGGFGLILLLLPVISFVGYSAMALLPMLLVVQVMKTAESSTAYSINNTARHVLWLPTTAEMKYKVKPAIETVFVRLGDGLAAATVLVGVQLYALSTRSFFLLNIALVVLWLVFALVVIREHARLVARG